MQEQSEEGQSDAAPTSGESQNGLKSRAPLRHFSASLYLLLLFYEQKDGIDPRAVLDQVSEIEKKI